MKTKRAIVDVDGTLWDLWGPVRDRIHQWYDIKMGEPDHWDYHQQFITDDQFYRAVRSAHASQVIYPAFHGATHLFTALHDAGYEVIVASHRQPQTGAWLAKWLEVNGLQPYSGVYCGTDKHFLIQAGDLVIDDAPKTIEYAWRHKARALTLDYTYNRAVVEQYSKLSAWQPAMAFQTLEEMAKWVQAQ